MELIWDQAYEEWGDCKGRAWCGTCHISLLNSEALNIISDKEEDHCLKNQSNRSRNSRLACQILLDKKINAVEIKFKGAT